MTNMQNLKSEEQRRLGWRCRRGMLELDIVLKRFVANQFDTLSLAEMHVLDEMLELPDNEFWALITASDLPVDATQRAIINKLNKA